MNTQQAVAPARRPWPGLLALALAMGTVVVGLSATPAEAAPRISVTSSLGSAKASFSGPTTVTVSGSGLQSIPKAFGGVYVTFGYVKNTGGWRPSQGGKSGRDYFYVSDSQSKDNQGYQRFVAFPGSNTSDSANGGTLSASGAFKLKMVIPGPTFSAETASGSNTTIDCREVQCGIFTFGAHGVANGNNESFTPINFGAATTNSGSTNQNSDATPNNAATQGSSNASGASGTTAPQQGTKAQGNATGTGTAQNPQDGAVPLAVTNGNPMLGIEQKTVVAGRALTFTGKGFAPGEQVVGTLASGITAAGPITAGTFGEVAGAVQIPADMVPGTHKLKLSGAGSGTSVEAEFSVMANPATLATASSESADGVWWALVAVIVAGSLLFLVVLASLITAIARRNKNPKTRPQSRKKRRPASRARGAAATVSGKAAAGPHEGALGGAPAQGRAVNIGDRFATEPEQSTNAIELLPEQYSRETV